MLNNMFAYFQNNLRVIEVDKGMITKFSTPVQCSFRKVLGDFDQEGLS